MKMALEMESLKMSHQMEIQKLKAELCAAKDSKNPDQMVNNFYAMQEEESQGSQGSGSGSGPFRSLCPSPSYGCA